MSEPTVPGGDSDTLTCPNGSSLSVGQFDMGMRELACPCGATHAVVMDVHPLARWIPEAVERILIETIETTDEYNQFGTMHLMGLVVEEFPDETRVYDASDDPTVGYALLWVSAFDAIELHRIIVELLVELMDHAIGHSDDPAVISSFEDSLSAFDIDAFVEDYRAQRDFSDEFDQPV